jgi:hypothetical protein
MKKGLLALVVGLVMVPALAAGTVSIVGNPSGYGPYQTGSGGEFTFQPSSGLSWILSAGYVSSGLTGTEDLTNVADQLGNHVTDTFQTFCVEEGEYIYPWSTYDASFSMGSIYTGKPLTYAAAYLYYEFATKGLADYDYSRAGSRPDTLALQQAIWYYMGVAGTQGSPDLTNKFIKDVEGTGAGQLGWTDAYAFTSGNDGYKVEVMNLWAQGHLGDQDYRRQDMLVLTVPDGGLTVMLLGIGIAVLAVISRRLGR